MKEIAVTLPTFVNLETRYKVCEDLINKYRLEDGYVVILNLLDTETSKMTQQPQYCCYYDHSVDKWKYVYLDYNEIRNYHANIEQTQKENNL